MVDPASIEDYVSPVSGGLCDDFTVTLTSGGPPEISPACERLQEWIETRLARAPEAARVRGDEVSLEAALIEAAQLLHACRQPLITGLSGTTTEIARAAVHLVETLNGVIDPCSGATDSGSLAGFQQFGISGASLGEIRQRSDLVLFWNADPLRLSPRFLERFCGESDRQFLKQGRADRHLVAISQASPDSSESPYDQRIDWSPEEQLESLVLLRRAIRNDSPLPFDGDAILSNLFSRLTDCSYGTMFFDFSEFPASLRFIALSELTLLVRELNDRTRFVMQSLAADTSLITARQVLCWQTGGPRAVRFLAGSPTYDPHANAALRMLEAEEVDFCVLVGSEWVGGIPERARRHLQRCDTIVLSEGSDDLPFIPTVEIRTSSPGFDELGTITRLDGVPLRLRQLVSTNRPSAAAILDRLRSEVLSAVAIPPGE